MARYINATLDCMKLVTKFFPKNKCKKPSRMKLIFLGAFLILLGALVGEFCCFVSFSNKIYFSFCVCSVWAM